MQLVAVWDRKLAKKGNVRAVYVLVHWADGTPEDATWELALDMMVRLPHFKWYP